MNALDIGVFEKELRARFAAEGRDPRAFNAEMHACSESACDRVFVRLLDGTLYATADISNRGGYSVVWHLDKLASSGLVGTRLLGISRFPGMWEGAV